MAKVVTAWRSLTTRPGAAGRDASKLAACADALLPRAIEPPERGACKGKPLLDCCGTGGGSLNLINISTGMAFILATMGPPVVKHGIRGLTKKSGSTNVLEANGASASTFRRDRKAPSWPNRSP